MQLSKLGHGLAVSAVSALVITGLAVTAPAALAADVDVDGVRMLSQQDGIASVRRDADAPFGTTVTLTAEQRDPETTVSFEFNNNPTAGNDADGWIPVSQSGYVAGHYVSVEWTPEPALVGTDVALRAVATTPATDEGPDSSTYSHPRAVALHGQGSSVHAVSLSSGFAPVSSPFFVQPYLDSSRTASLLAVTGTTSATDGTVELSAWNAEDGSFQGSVAAVVSPAELKISFNSNAPEYIDGGRFTGVLDISAFDAGDGDVLAVRAERDSDAVVPHSLSVQTISSIDFDNALVAGPEDTVVTLNVIDQDRRPIVGAEVRRSSDGTLVGYTDTKGQVAASQRNSTTESYYANTTDTDAFEEAVDVATGPVETPAYVPAATSTQAVLADGAVFDDQEYAPGDISLQVVDAQGKPFAAEEDLTYSLHPTGQEPPRPTRVTTDEDGRVVVPFDPSLTDGQYTLAFTTPGSAGGEDQEPVTFVAGDAVLGLTPVAGKASAGGQITYTGSLSVEGAPLAGRKIDLTYTRGTEQAPGTEADASLLMGDQRTLEGATTSGPHGTFAVIVDDLDETGNPAETGGKLRVVARGLGDTVDATADFVAPATPPPAEPTPVPTADTGKGTAKLRLSGSNAGDRSDRLRVRGPSSAAGERIRIHVRTIGGHWRVVRTLRLDDKGDASSTVRDRNGNRVTRYRVRLLPNPRLFAFTSKVLRRR